MKTYRVYAKYEMYCYIDVQAESEDEAYEIATDADGGSFIADNNEVWDDSWDLYDCKEVTEKTK